MSEIRTSPVRFLGGPLGLVTADEPYRFVEQTVGEGDLGELIVQGELPIAVPDGWVLVRVGDLYAPVHPSSVERVAAR
jgi:hypothetical protein